MPLERYLFDESPPPPETDTVYAYLDAHDDQAFTTTELANRLNLDWETVGTALHALYTADQVRFTGRYWANTSDHNRSTINI